MVNKYIKYVSIAILGVTALLLVLFGLMDFKVINPEFTNTKQVAGILGALFFAITFLLILIKYLTQRETKISFAIPFICGLGFFNIYYDFKLLNVGITILSAIVIFDYLYTILKNEDVFESTEDEKE
ncbi:hypothetical protein RH915_07300 [Serpentinicella sp. ANB-PHB4]|uniref:hypothetical protein n=1 Tax=Serpentinicella sp. ANB-PHB4 TaxID=3074076 RepID=UPI00285C4E67|nr:hypothetical protein [Serpentinicella sp. ANB-PHB4]MDR5659292.1 hypothetical protein [Serpentinicella sp. ANB-PHB4]